MNRLLEHPPCEQLSAFGLGILDDEEASAIQDHLETCGDCQAAVETVPDDTLASLVRQSSASSNRTNGFEPRESPVAIAFN